MAKPVAKPHILMLLAKCYRPDPRVVKEANSFVEAGYQVTVICLDRRLEMPAEEWVHGVFVVGIQVGVVSNASVSSVGPALIRFRKKARAYARELHEKNPVHIVHAHDFDTVGIGYSIKRLLDCPLVYDLHDLYSSFIPSELLKTIVNRRDRYFYRKADALVLVNEKFREVVQPEDKKAVIVMNSPASEGGGITDETSSGLFYAGGLSERRDFRYIFDDGATLSCLIAGDGPHVESYRHLAKAGHAKLEVLGWVSQEEIEQYTSTCFAVLALYDPSFANNQLATPNKLFQGMKYGKPAIVSKGTVMAEIVEEWACGVTVKYGCRTSFEDGVNALLDPAVYASMAENAYRAFCQKYSWDIMFKRLLKKYDELL